MWPDRVSPKEHQRWVKRSHNGEAPPFVPEIVRRYPALFLEIYEEAFGDGLHGNPPRSFFHLYQTWYQEGVELRKFIGSLGQSSP